MYLRAGYSKHFKKHDSFKFKTLTPYVIIFPNKASQNEQLYT